MATVKQNLILGETTQAKGPRVLDPIVHPRKLRTVGSPSDTAVAVVPMMTPLISTGSFWRVWTDADILAFYDNTTQQGITNLDFISGFLWEDATITTDDTNDNIVNVLVGGQIDGQEVLDRVFSETSSALDVEIVKCIAAGTLTLAALTQALKDLPQANSKFDVVGLVDVR